MDTSVTFHLESFDGPLDLLMHLISKNKIDIKDIPIAELLDQYLEYLEEMRRMDMDIACEFIVMAAQLIFIKTKLLLPVQKDAETEEDPRQKLVESLLEYQRYKEISAFFKLRHEIGRDIFVKSPEPLPKTAGSVRYEYSHTPEDMRKAVRNMIERANQKLPPSVSSFRGIVGYEPEPVEPKIQLMLGRLMNDGQILFNSAFAGTKSRSEIVATFLALLELMNMKRVKPVDEDGECVLVLSDKED